MFSNPSNAARNYSNVNVTTGVMSANPHRLVVMLFEGAMIAVAAARMHLGLNQTPEKAKSISKAVAIIQDGLMASLDRDSGGELADRLFSLYEYMVTRLTEANMHNRAEPLEETGRLLGELSDAWKSIGDTDTPGAPGASGE